MEIGLAGCPPEVTYDAVTSVYTDIVGAVCAGEAVFELNSENLVSMRKAC